MSRSTAVTLTTASLNWRRLFEAHRSRDLMTQTRVVRFDLNGAGSDSSVCSCTVLAARSQLPSALHVTASGHPRHACTQGRTRRLPPVTHTLAFARAHAKAR